MFYKIQKWGLTSAHAELAKNQLELPHHAHLLHLIILKSRPKPTPLLHSAAQDHIARPASTEGTLSLPLSSAQSFPLLNTSDSDSTRSFSSLLLRLKITMTDMEEFLVLRYYQEKVVSLLPWYSHACLYSECVCLHHLLHPSPWQFSFPDLVSCLSGNLFPILYLFETGNPSTCDSCWKIIYIPLANNTTVSEKSVCKAWRSLLEIGNFF